MAFKDGNAPSLWSKLALAFFTLIGVIFAIRHVQFSLQVNPLHNAFLITCTLVFFIRLVIALFIFIKRKVSWFEGISVGVLYGIMLVGFSNWGTEKNSSILFWDLTGMLLYCIGSVINSLSDYQRHVWKLKPEHHQRIYTQGLFKYSMHINYFGDGLMLIGFAVVTQNLTSFIPPIVIILNLIFLQIPKLDEHLKNKYGEEYLVYESKVKKFIPYIY